MNTIDFTDIISFYRSILTTPVVGYRSDPKHSDKVEAWYDLYFMCLDNLNEEQISPVYISIGVFPGGGGGVLQTAVELDRYLRNNGAEHCVRRTFRDSVQYHEHPELKELVESFLVMAEMK